jgi:hypothetical protein
MYEIWLGLNIVWETLLEVWPLLAAGVLVWAVLAAVAVRRGGHWRQATLPALGVAAVLAVVALLVLPSATGSSLAEMGYWVDWAGLAGLAAAAGGIAGLFAWPLLAMRR